MKPLHPTSTRAVGPPGVSGASPLTEDTQCDDK